MHLHILGICGTFMGGIAAIAREAGPPRDRLRRQRLPADERPAARAGHRAHRGLRRRRSSRLQPDVFVIGNVVTRGKHR
jgi:UDP-N-acetylmuramate: L-alanyl-gamma-D-glutamyl-meso-diaminopimelate ligase